MNTSWIGKAVGILVLAAVFVLLWLSHKLERRGVLKNYSRGLGRGLLELDAMLRPSKQHVQQAKEEKKEGEDDQGEGTPPQDG
jgi:hypothetical protein